LAGQWSVLGKHKNTAGVTFVILSPVTPEDLYTVQSPLPCTGNVEMNSLADW